VQPDQKRDDATDASEMFPRFLEITS